MNVQELVSRYDYLVGVSVACRKTYFEDGASDTPDAGYDRIVEEIEELELLLDESYHSRNSPTKVVGLEALRSVGFDIVDHCEPMLSLAKTRDYATCIKFDKSVTKRLGPRIGKVHYILERKYDGLALELIYRRRDDDVVGLHKAILRGDGNSGEDVTANAMHVRSIPDTLNISLARHESVCIRGEIVLNAYELQRINRELKEFNPDAMSYKTTRHCATASLRQLDPNVTKHRPLTFIAYQLINAEDILDTQIEVLDYLNELGFITQTERTVISGMDDAHNAATRMWYAINPNGKQPQFEYPIDGIVIKVNDLNEQSILGATSHHPNWAIAYKFKDEGVVTTVTGVEYGMGRNGRLTPVITFEPVEINGITVSRATIANVRTMEWQNWYVGSKAQVCLSGMCIPKISTWFDWETAQERFPMKIEEVTAEIVAVKPEYFSRPLACPFCQQPTIMQGDSYLTCENMSGCEEQIVKRLAYFASPAAMRFTGFGEKMVREAVSILGMSNANQFFELDGDKLKRMGLSGRTAFKMDNLIKSRTMRVFNEEPWRYIAGLCIPGIGLETARDLISTYSNLESIKLRTAETIAATGIINANTAAALLAAMVSTD